MIKEPLQSVEIDIQCGDAESVWCKLSTPEMVTMALDSFYRPPGTSVEAIRSLETILFTLPDDRLLLAGDFNFPDLKWNGNAPSGGVCSEFHDIITTYGLMAANGFPANGHRVASHRLNLGQCPERGHTLAKGWLTLLTKKKQQLYTPI